MRLRTLFGALLELLACSVVRAERVTAMRLPDGGIYPQVQTDSRGRAHLIYFNGDPMGGDIFYVRSDDGGATFTPPIRVNSQPRSAAIVGIVRGPHLAVGRNDRVHVAWMGSDKAEPKATGKAIPMLYTRLNEAGDAFEPQRNVIQNHPGLDGGGSVAADREGNVYVAWHAPQDDATRAQPGVNHATSQPKNHERSGHDDAGGQNHGGHSKRAAMDHDEESRTVWIARSRDDGKTFEAETVAFDKKLGVCACCGMRIFATDKGRLFVVFRSAHEKVNSDIHVLVSDDNGETFEDAAIESWKIGVCGMSTASFAQGGDGGVLGVWETEEQVRFARFNGAHAHSVAPASMPGDGKKRKHPTVAVNGHGQYVVAWTEGIGWNKGGSLVWQVYDAEGHALSDGAGRADDLPTWSVPAAFVAPDGAFKLLY